VHTCIFFNIKCTQKANEPLKTRQALDYNHFISKRKTKKKLSKTTLSFQEDRDFFGGIQQFKEIQRFSKCSNYFMIKIIHYTCVHYIIMAIVLATSTKYTQGEFLLFYNF